MKARRALWKQQGFTPTRQGTPDGWSGKQKHLGAIHQVYTYIGKQTARKMAEQNLLTTDDERGEDAIAEAIAIYKAQDPESGRYIHSARSRLEAIKIVADFCKQKPATKSSVTVTTAEDFLKQLARGDR